MKVSFTRERETRARLGRHAHLGHRRPREIERANPRLHLVEALPVLYAPGTQRLSFGYRLVAQLVRPFKRMRNISFYLRYRF
jgi:hypothetical protein